MFFSCRYVHGIGSETRNSLFHLHNSHDFILVTTCRHGKSWRELQDARCDEDNREYDRWVIYCNVESNGYDIQSFWCIFNWAILAQTLKYILCHKWTSIDFIYTAWTNERMILTTIRIFIICSLSNTKYRLTKIFSDYWLVCVELCDFGR